jgi:hypothetical protein
LIIIVLDSLVVFFLLNTVALVHIILKYCQLHHHVQHGGHLILLDVRALVASNLYHLTSFFSSDLMIDEDLRCLLTGDGSWGLVIGITAAHLSLLLLKFITGN